MPPTKNSNCASAHVLYQVEALLEDGWKEVQFVTLNGTGAQPARCSNLAEAFHYRLRLAKQYPGCPMRVVVAHTGVMCGIPAYWSTTVEPSWKPTPGDMVTWYGGQLPAREQPLPRKRQEEPVWDNNWLNEQVQDLVVSYGWPQAEAHDVVKRLLNYARLDSKKMDALLACVHTAGENGLDAETTEKRLANMWNILEAQKKRRRGA